MSGNTSPSLNEPLNSVNIEEFCRNIKELEPSKQPASLITALKQTDRYGWPAFIRAIEETKGFESLCELTELLEPKDKTEILQIADIAKENALMVSIRTKNNPAFKAILYVIKSLASDDDKKVILNQCNNIDDNALHLAIKEKHDDAFGAILDVIKSLASDDDKKVILNKCNCHGYNPLQLAITEKSSAAVKAIFEIIQSLNDNDKEAILNQVNNYGDNALQLAIDKGPVAIKALCDGIKTLDPEFRKKYLMQMHGINNYNALMLAASSKNDGAVEAILSVIEPLGNQAKKAILSATSSFKKNNALMIASSQGNVTNVTAISNVIQSLDDEIKETILCLRDQFDNRNLFELGIIRKNSNNINAICDVINSIASDDKKIEILETAFKCIDRISDDKLAFLYKNIREKFNPTIINKVSLSCSDNSKIRYILMPVDDLLKEIFESKHRTPDGLTFAATNRKQELLRAYITNEDKQSTASAFFHQSPKTEHLAIAETALDKKTLDANYTVKKDSNLSRLLTMVGIDHRTGSQAQLPSRSEPAAGAGAGAFAGP